MDTKWLHIEDFSDVITEHDNFAAAGNFDDWYKKFSSNATQLADYFLLSFSSVRDRLPGRDELIHAFQSGTTTDFEYTYSKVGSRAFRPWFNWYYGYWDNGTNRTANYHIWDNTVPVAGRYMQPVTQSVTDFAYSKDKSGSRVKVLEDMIKRKKTDLGVDFLSPDHGVTGWVTKLQGKTIQQLAHVGYLIGDKILIWMAQYVGGTADEWFMFFERGNRTSRASLYSVDGVVVKVDDTTGVSAGNTSGNGKVEYYCQIPYSQECEANLRSACDEK